MPSHAVERFEDPKQDQVVKDFAGVNTQASRTAIAENEFAWLENLMPVGHANLKVVPAPSEVLFSLPAGALVNYWKYVNIRNTDYLLIIPIQGHGYLVNLATYALTVFAGPGGFVGTVAAAQWKNERILIVDQNNYRSYDGTLFLSNGDVESVAVTAPGTYTTIPTISFTGGGGYGATAVASMALLSGAQTVSTAGTGYAVGQLLTFDGGTSTSVAKVRVDTIGGGGSITGASAYQGGSYTVLPTSPNVVTGGSGTGAQITPAWGVDSIAVTTQLVGAVVYTSPPTVVFSAGAATATATLMQGPDGGQTIATFAGRVWIGKDRTVSYSAPTSFTDFTDGSAGGSFVITDETLISNINHLVTANNFLYIFGDASINVVSDVRVTGTPAVTLFSNVTISPGIGSDLPYSVFPYYRTLGFATRYGFYALVGSTPQKISDPLDGMFTRIDLDEPVTGDIAKIFNILCMAFCFTYNDPAAGARQLIAINFNKKWFFSSQGSIQQIVATYQGGVPTIFGTDGANIYKLFSDSTAAIASKLVTPLWSMKSPTRTKQTLKGGVEVNAPDSLTMVDASVDTSTATLPVQLSGSNLAQWANTSGALGDWINSGGDTGGWLTVGFQIFQGNVESAGRYVGYTVTSESPNFTIEGLLMQYEKRANWAAGGTA